MGANAEAVEARARREIILTILTNVLVLVLLVVLVLMCSRYDVTLRRVEPNQRSRARSEEPCCFIHSSHFYTLLSVGRDILFGTNSQGDVSCKICSTRPDQGDSRLFGKDGFHPLRGSAQYIWRQINWLWVPGLLSSTRFVSKLFVGCTVYRTVSRKEAVCCMVFVVRSSYLLLVVVR